MTDGYSSKEEADRQIPRSVSIDQFHTWCLHYGACISVAFDNMTCAVASQQFNFGYQLPLRESADSILLVIEWGKDIKKEQSFSQNKPSVHELRPVKHTTRQA